jgi:hypothetical protein
MKNHKNNSMQNNRMLSFLTCFFVVVENHSLQTDLDALKLEYDNYRTATCSRSLQKAVCTSFYFSQLAEYFVLPVLINKKKA